MIGTTVKRSIVFLAVAAVFLIGSHGGSFAQQDDEERGKGVVERRLAEEQAGKRSRYLLLPHRPTYILPVTFNDDPNSEPYRQQFPQFADDRLDEVEAKFQISFKVPLWVDMFGKKVDFYAGYTQVSFWQSYKSEEEDEISAPFRETNYEPEAFLWFRDNFEFWGFKNSIIGLHFNHQSNGRAGVLSRSWNRIIATFLFERGDFLFGIRPWYRIPEDEEDDDNPDMWKYYGYGELYGMYNMGEHLLAAMFRNNIQTEHNKSTIELNWSFPMPFSERLRGLIQYFNGYGESLIDYDEHTQRIGVGLMVADWL